MGKSKLQISRSLDERINGIISSPNETASEFSTVASAYILGFNYGSVTNYVGLTTDYQACNAVLPVVGIVYFVRSPSDDEIREQLKLVKEYSSSPEGLGSFKSDENEHLFLVYFKDEETNRADKKIFDSKAGSFLPDQSTTILEDAKIYSHSAMVKLTACFKLDILDDGSKICGRDKISAEIDAAKAILSSGKGLKLHLKSSNFSTSNPLNEKALVESLYGHLDVPNEVLQMADYLPQMTKEDKKKLSTKWHNKIKDQRYPMEMEFEHDDLSVGSDEVLPKNFYNLRLEEYLHMQVNDAISKGTKCILMLLRQKMNLIKSLLMERTGQKLELAEIKSCTFKPAGTNHCVSSVYLLPSETKPDFERLRECRSKLHLTYLIPLSRPAVRFSQRIVDVNLKTRDEQQGYLCNVHSDIKDKSGIKGGAKSIIGGTYTYHHYLQDRAQDSGWGCAYRSLQTIISWFKHQGYIYSPDVEPRAPAGLAKGADKTSPLRDKLHAGARVPTHEEIQSVLVDVGDKQANFVGSQKWIGSQEVCYVLNHLFNLESKFISVSSGGELVYKARDLGQHFGEQSTPVMIGGGVLAHTIIGLDFNEKNGDISYLILDPHYTGAEDLASITKKGWCGWKKNVFWDKSSFYNLCLPQRPVEF